MRSAFQQWRSRNPVFICSLLSSCKRGVGEGNTFGKTRWPFANGRDLLAGIWLFWVTWLFFCFSLIQQLTFLGCDLLSSLCFVVIPAFASIVIFHPCIIVGIFRAFPANLLWLLI
uniref:Uncharacterized protein n=1 Tax=Hemiselmis andersenii TaxID=464988 RepID=A0A7S1E366_HEMAN|mmetsp:Transcript_3489/g.8412  ORF Transcript_3489/g.8412 Transcript_3489/m.8412 type:complete len:115 (+) Transcript_3489:109-453(+)